jgi:rubredoxin
MNSGRDMDKFDGFTTVARSENGLLHLTEVAGAYLSCKVTQVVDLGSHFMFISELTDAEVLSSAPSCTYAYYQSDIKPKPKAPAKKGYVCSVCGYVYEGDEVPDDYLCPLCKHGKEVFVPLEEKKSKKWVCTVCGYVHEGDTPPEICPLCKQPADKFKEV